MAPSYKIFSLTFKNYNLCFSNLFLTQGSQQISSRDIGYVLRILGQNPTEDEIVEMVMKVGCIEGLKLATVGMFWLYTQQTEGCALNTIQGRRFLAFKRVRFTFWPLPAK